MKKEKLVLFFCTLGLSFSLLYSIGCSKNALLKKTEAEDLIEKEYGDQVICLKKDSLIVQVRTNAAEVGQFTIGISDKTGKKIGTPLLYNHPRGPWSHINILVVDGDSAVVFSNSNIIYEDPQIKPKPFFPWRMLSISAT